MRISLTLFIFLFLISQSLAAPWKLNQAKEEGGAFLAGFVSGYAAHELGHIAVARSMGFDTDFDGMTIIYPESQMSDSEHLQIASAGFQTQWLVSEAALRYRENRQMTAAGDSYNAGLVFSHLAITAAYMTILLNHEDGDLQGMSEATGISNDKLAALAAIPALLDSWRLFGDNVPRWAPALSAGSKGIGIVMIWSY